MLAASRNRKGELSELVAEQLGECKRERALIVEANPVDLVGSRISLLEAGFNEVDAAISLKQAYEQLKQQKYQMLVVDYFLPDGDGLELMEWMDDQCEVIMLAGQVALSCSVAPRSYAAIEETRQAAFAF